jgi:carboxylesterase type B
MSVTFKHAPLGDLKGNSVDGAVQFLGLKYASLKNRFAPAELIESYGGGADATKFGSVVLSYLVNEY